ncbi:MAG: spore maturation protein, partial [Clostridiales bacterium]|nr:spore maturation protein [Clostridiales bacterium]
MSVYVLPALVIILLVVCIIKRVKVYDCFLEGTKDSLGLIKS